MDTTTKIEAEAPDQVPAPALSESADASTEASTALPESLSLFVDESSLRLPVLAVEFGQPTDIVQSQYSQQLDPQLPELQHRAPTSRAEQQFLAVAQSLLDECRRIEVTARETRDRSDDALRAAQEIAQRLETLAEVRDLSGGTVGQLTALNGLVEGIAGRIETLDHQNVNIDSQLAALSGLAKGIADRIETLERHDSGMDSQLAALSGLARGVAGGIESLERQNVGIDDQLGAVRSLARDVVGRVEALERRNSGIHAQLATLSGLADGIESLKRQNVGIDRQLATLATLGRLATDAAGRLETLERRNREITSSMAVLTRQEAAIKKLTTMLGRVSKIEKLVGVLVKQVRQLRKGGSVEAHPSGAGLVDLPREYLPAGIEVPEDADTTPAADLSDGAWERRSLRWTQFTRSLRAVARRVVPSRAAAAAVAGVLLVAASVLVISTGRGLVARRQDPAPLDASRSNIVPVTAAGVPASAPVGAEKPATEGQSRPESVEEPLATRKPPAASVDAGAAKPESQGARFVGTLVVRSDPPGATVLVDGQPVGRTPLELTGLRASSHVVWMEQEGHRRWTAAVRVVANQTTRISATLEADPE